MLPYIEVLSRLEHRQFKSGQELANALGVTRATVHNCILKLEQMGITIKRVRGKGYKLLSSLDELNHDMIQSGLSSHVSEKLAALEILHEIDSTNEYIKQQSLPMSGQFSVVLADRQSAGKGRRGRTWVSPYAANVYMSVLWPLQKSLSEAGALSAWLSLSMVKALNALSVESLGLKWPNDVYCRHMKLAGLLIECSGEVNGNSRMIIGMGVNVYMSQRDNVQIDQQWTDIISHTTNTTVTRDQVVASLLNYTIPILDKFENTEMQALADHWEKWDIMKNKPVVLHTPQGDVEGVAKGIDANGCLLLETNQGMQHISAGDVSLREQA